MSQKWGLNEVIFEKAIETYSSSNPRDIPYIDELTRNVDYDSIDNPETSNLLEHNMKLMKALPEIVPKIKRKYK